MNLSETERAIYENRSRTERIPRSIEELVSEQFDQLAWQWESRLFLRFRQMLRDIELERKRKYICLECGFWRSHGHAPDCVRIASNDLYI